MEWYTINNNFLDYLRDFESRIPKVDYGVDKLKPFFGKLFEIADLCYVVSISHAKKEKHEKMKNSKDFIKLYDGPTLISVINLNYMFPVHKNNLIKIEYGNIEKFRLFKTEEEKNNYIALLKKEKKSLIENKITTKAEKLYIFKYDFPDNIISKRCFDFKALEQQCLEYHIKKEIL